MTRVVRAGDLVGLPVVSIETGEDIAEVRDVVYDASVHRLIGFTLNKRGFFSGRLKDVLPAEAITGIGPDAVMLPDERAITDSATPTALAEPKGNTSVIGHRAISADGSDLGTISGVIVGTGLDHAAVGYEIEPDDGSASMFVPISAQMALSDKNLILPEGATDFMRNDLAGFGAAIEDFRTETIEGGH